MTVRTRFTVWFSGILFLALLLMGLLSYHELVVEPRGKMTATEAADKAPPLDDVVEFLIWCGVVPLTLALAGGWWMIRQALKPIAALTQAAEGLNEHNLGQPLFRNGNGDELDRLTEVFNKMTERLQQSFERIHEFTLHASHELKTPLTILHAELETTLHDQGLSAAHHKSVESQLDEIQRLTKIVDALTLLTKADTGQVRLNFDLISLDELVREALSDAQSLARPQEIKVGLGECDRVLVRGDRHRLRQLLLNLCDNAVKYNYPQGTVMLTLNRTADGAAAFTIANSGPGILAEVRDRIFERFFRGDSSHSNSREGCGLGLSIAEWIIRAHGGSIRVDSGRDRLTTFTVELPATAEGKCPPLTGATGRLDDLAAKVGKATRSNQLDDFRVLSSPKSDTFNTDLTHELD